MKSRKIKGYLVWFKNKKGQVYCVFEDKEWKAMELAKDRDFMYVTSFCGDPERLFMIMQERYGNNIKEVQGYVDLYYGQ